MVRLRWRIGRVLTRLVGDMPEESRILEEMIQLKEMSSFILSGTIEATTVGKITRSEAVVLQNKKIAELVGGGRRVFPVSDTASEADIDRWLNHPGMNKDFTDKFILNIASQTPVPTKMMERILRSLLGKEYERYHGIAEEHLLKGT